MKARVFFATITGNNEDVADVIVDEFQQAGVEVTKEDFMDADAADIDPSDTDIVVAVAYTFDKGTLADEALDFYDDMETMDWSGLIYGAAGSGDVFYGNDFAVAVDLMEARFAETGAIKGAEGVKVNLSPDDEAEAVLRAFTKQLIATAK
ncbi:MAG: flavodoxin domain-containing protein [Lactobacillaceae bacterium]|jgi:flavodoxin short chain|nr:flavodoxin domain-containing protein [Lactobacillaceae bacterium]